MYSGYTIPPYYDSMCAKITVWALEWDELINRARRALHDTGVYGVKTTIPYYLAVLDAKEFRAACFNTSFVENHPELVNYKASRPTRELAAVIAATIASNAGY